jgi:hypothetical protein
MFYIHYIGSPFKDALFSKYKKVMSLLLLVMLSHDTLLLILS